MKKPLVGIICLLLLLITACTTQNPDHLCTKEENQTTACTKEYIPVCADDGVTYGNDCVACASEEVSSWVQGSCES